MFRSWLVGVVILVGCAVESVPAEEPATTVRDEATPHEAAATPVPAFLRAPAAPRTFKLCEPLGTDLDCCPYPPGCNCDDSGVCTLISD